MTRNADELVGYTIGDYQLTRVLGTGGAGTVYLAFPVSQPDKQMAIKVLMPPTMNPQEQQEFRQRFIREARTLTTLSHPHILSVLTFGEDETTGFVYMVMPYLPGGTLADRLGRGEPLPLAHAMEYVHQLADALDYAHDHQIIHRDLKPANVLLDEHDQVYLADFGVAKWLDQQTTTITNVQQAIGTPGYMAPEQIAGQAAGPATDIYGLGILTYQLVTGKLPFATSSLAATLFQIVSETPISPREFRPELPQPAADVILRAMAKHPEERFSSASAFARALERGLHDKQMTPSPQTLIQAIAVEGTAPQPDEATASWLSPHPKRWRSSRAMIIFTCLAAIFVVIGSISVILSPHPRQQGSLALLPSVFPTSTPPNTANTVPIAPTSTETSPGLTSPTATHIPLFPVASPPTLPPSLPTPTPAPGHLVSSVTAVSIPPETIVTPFTGCQNFSTAGTTLTNDGGQTVSWQASYIMASSQAGSIGSTPSSGTLAPHQSVAVTILGTIFPNEVGWVIYSWGGGSVTETIYCQ
jgi:serine/threonine protein kinase